MVRDKPQVIESVTLSSTPLSRWLGRILWIAVAVLGCRIWLSILSEYRWYFPPNFDEGAFLIGRREYFGGVYRIAFYAHILASPIAIALATALFLSALGFRQPRTNWLRKMLLKATGSSSNSARLWYWHKLLGKMEIVLVVLLVVPSGLVMAWGTLFGPIAALGFSAHSLSTLVAAIATYYYASKRNMKLHQGYATACWILLCGPLVFRVTSGIANVTNWESPLVYQVNAWTSWLVPTLVYLTWNLASNTRSVSGRYDIDE